MKNTQLSQPRAVLALFGKEASTAPNCAAAPWLPISLHFWGLHQTTAAAMQECTAPIPRALLSREAASELTPMLGSSLLLCFHLPGSFNATPKKWIFQLWILHQKRERKKKKKTQTAQLIQDLSVLLSHLALFCLACTSGDTGLYWSVCRDAQQKMARK